MPFWLRLRERMRYDEFTALATYDRRRIDTPTVAGGQEYGEWLATRAPWQLFVTLTVKDLFGDSVHHKQGDGRQGYWSKNSDQLGFTNIGVAGSERFIGSWFRNSIRNRSWGYGYHPYGAFAMEYHKDRVTPHFHGLVGGMPPWMVTDTQLGIATRGVTGGRLWKEWYQDHGRCRIEPIRGVVGDSHVALGAARYAAKYVTKDSGKFYALGMWPDKGGSITLGEEDYTRWEMLPGSGNAERVWREMCEGLPIRF